MGERIRPIPSHERTAQGLLETGNIDLLNRPLVFNPSRTGMPVSTSTINSMSFQDDEHGPEILVPQTFVSGNVPADLAALHYQLTGKHLGKFDTPEHATDYAKKLHEEYAAGWYDDMKRAAMMRALRSK